MLMNESHKTNLLRSQQFKDNYIRGRIIDIGAGADLVTPLAEPFDLAQGDANRILEYREPSTYDCVHSSHCLEHMRDPGAALAQWWGLLQPGGYLVLVVPEESLYEQGFWPSMFNPDHKHTFRLDNDQTWSPVSIDIRALCSQLEGAEVIEAQVQNDGYDHRLRPTIRPHGVIGDVFFRIIVKARARLLQVPLFGQTIDGVMVRICRAINSPVDQTLGNAVAQIQVVVQKRGNYLPPII